MFLVYVVFTDRNDLNWILKIPWTYLHLRSLHRVVVVFPMVPHHSLIIDLAVKIQTIQVGVVAIIVPPGAFIFHCTVTTVAVKITIFGGKWISSVSIKGISSGTLKKRSDNNNTLNYIVLVFHMSCLLVVWLSSLLSKQRNHLFNMI